VKNLEYDGGCHYFVVTQISLWILSSWIKDHPY